MDGFFSYILNYQDAAGAVFTTRVFTNNPNAGSDELAHPCLEKALKASGYELLAVAKVEELHSCMEGRPAVAVAARWYRWALGALFVVTMAGTAVDFLTYARIFDRLDQLEAADRQVDARLLTRMNDAKRIEASLAYRLGKLEELLGGGR